jgi:hypothetical protein
MNEVVGSAVGQLALLAVSWSMMAVGLWRFAECAETVVSTEGKQQTRDWLLAVEDERPWQAMANSFGQAFDAVFGNTHLSWKCFRRSVAASFLFTASLCVLWLAARQVPSGFASDVSAVEAVATLTVVMLLMSSGPDYISLLKTRYVLAKLRTSRSRARTVMLVVADATGSAALGMLAIYALAVIGAREHFLELTSVDLLRYLLQANLDLVGLGGATLPLDLWFYATFLTSLWLWLFVLSKHMAGVARYLNIAASTRRWIDLDTQPFLALGAGSILIVTVAYFVVVPFVILF